MDSILIVDDVEINRKILKQILMDSYRIYEACDGQQALDFVRQQSCCLSLILLDIIMPKFDGYEVLRQLKLFAATKNVPVILISALDSECDESRGLKEGAIDYITKPFNMHIVKCRVDNHIRLKRYQDHLLELADQRAQKILNMRESIYDAVTSIIEYRSLESGGHVKRIRLFCEAQLDFLRNNGMYSAELDEHAADLIARASSLHDIGKVSIPDRILTKPGPLTNDEMEIMKTHSEIGGRFIDSLSDQEDELFILFARQICRHHHEHWDGNGYPDGLKGNKIPLAARVVAVADVYDALVSPRVYKPAFSHEKATQILLEENGKLFDPTLIEVYSQIEYAFIEISQKHGDEVRQ